MPTPPPRVSAPPAPEADGPDADVDVERVVHVTAVVVAHHGARWLPELADAVRAQTRAPEVVVAADTGSTDGSREQLGTWVPPDRIAVLPGRTGFGDAVRAALALAPEPPVPPQGNGRSRWLWLLHDDCAPAPGALAALLAEVTRDPGVAIAGPKVRGWADRRALLEVGVTIARSGRRETLLDRREQDQGQHDGLRAVLAVSTAGMLVRRDVWDTLGGLDPSLPFLLDDVDLGWRANLAGHRVVCVTDAVVHHQEATARGRRPVAPGGHRLHRMDREHSMFVLMANLPLFLVPGAVLSLTLTSLVRMVGLLAGKLPTSAADEAMALLAVMGRPGRLVRARAVRRRTRVVPSRRVLHLLAPRRAGLRRLVETASLVAGARAGAALGGRHRVEPRPTSAPGTGPTSEDDEDLPTTGLAGSLLRRAFVRPSVGLALGLALLTVVATRGLVGDGRLLGGALLPAPDTAGALWRSYVSAWHPVGLGSPTEAPPYLAVLALLGAVAGGAPRAVDLLLLGAVPLSGLSAYLALARLVRSVPLRIWAAVSYALLPPVLGAVATGRLGTAVLSVLLPPAAALCARALGLGVGDRRAGDDRATWAAALLLAVMTAFVPLTAVLVAVLALAVAGMLRGPNLWRVAVLVVVPPMLLLPWLPALGSSPASVLLEGGLPGPGLSEVGLSPVEILLLRPGGPGMPPLVSGAALLLAALAALLRPDRRRPVLAGWLIAFVGLAAAVLTSRLRATAPALETAVPAWPGPGLLLAGAGLVLAAAAGAQGARRRVVTSSFGWRQPGAAALSALALLAPLATAGWWASGGAGSPLERRDPLLLPAFVVADAAEPHRPRTLVLSSRATGVTYALLRGQGPRTGDAELTRPADERTGLDPVVADLASGRGGDAAARLVTYGVRYVLLRRPVEEDAALAIDAVPGMVRVSGPSGSVLWRVDYPTGRLRVLPRGAPVVDDGGAPPPAQVLPSGQVGADTRVAAGEAGRLLVLADPREPGWRATLDGRALPARTYAGWAQAFLLPADGGRLRVHYDQGSRPVLLWLQAGALVLVVVLALPQARTGVHRDREDEAVTR